MTDIRLIAVVDTETTGVDPAEGAALLEIAAVPISRDGPEATWDRPDVAVTCMIEHVGPIPPEARAVHHISPEQVAPGAPGVVARDVAVGEMLAAEVPGEMLYAAHNARFDSSFLPELELPWICTWRCARHIWPDAPGHGNQVLRYWLGLEVPAGLLGEFVPSPEADGGQVWQPLAPHRAQYDAAVTSMLLLRMLEDHTPEDLLRLTSEPILLSTLRFGKHRGERFSDVPRDYLRWLLNKSDMCREDADLNHTVRYHLDG